ncbi:MAG: hypothetical protein N3D11_15195 [Candidatus Sumerlaeia bacterium]|nr:hypothetical protein [Candidatus Sumerlaeia bacterium]
MNLSLATRCSLFGAIIGFIAGLLVEWGLLAAQIEPIRFLKTLCTVGGAVLCVAGMWIRELIFLRDYKKLVVERQKRMHW